MNSVRLDGLWKLYSFPQDSIQINVPEDLETKGIPWIPAEVPGNVELDMVRSGLLPDPMFGMNIKELRPLETREWWYTTEFAAPANGQGKGMEIVFHGADCLATYWVNGAEIGISNNMFIEHRFDVTDILKFGVPNTLAVRLKSPFLEAMIKEYNPSMYAFPTNWEQLYLRKAAHSYGWDIMPRALSAGLWRPVEIVVHTKTEITDLYFYTISVEKDLRWAQVGVFYTFHCDPALHYDGLEIRVSGKCGESVFESRKKAVFKAGTLTIPVDSPELWWPRGYGDANLYEVVTELVHGGKVLTSRKDRVGVRLAELLRTEVTTSEEAGEFLFKVNHTPIFCKGSNWLPLDTFHSRDAAKYEKALELYKDLECNIVRCWGGNVYEDHAFFDLCDRFGLMVWQDFAIACTVHPQSPDFLEAMRVEAKAVVRKLRNHPSLILWCGDNEVDLAYGWAGLPSDPNTNKITRVVFPEIVAQCDPHRTYMPSSPYLSPKTKKTAGDDQHMAPERHLWGPRDYYKSSFFTTSTHHFVSEIGFEGVPNLSSMQKFLSPESLWPWQNNEQWMAHVTETLGPDGPFAYRLPLIANQIKEMFGTVPENIADFIAASQITHGEAMKYFIESNRVKKWRRTGIIWWNVLDGWPQFADSLVDYYFSKKLAYYYVRRVQQPFCIMVDEPESWHVRVVAGNDSNKPSAGEYRVWDADTGETMLEGAFRTEANENRELGRIRVSLGEQKLFLIQWNSENGNGANHYLQGYPGFSLEMYRNWLPKIAGLLGDFVADDIGK